MREERTRRPKDRGFPNWGMMYVLFLLFVIDLAMIEELHFFLEKIKKENAHFQGLLLTRKMLLSLH